MNSVLLFLLTNKNRRPPDADVQSKSVSTNLFRTDGLNLAYINRFNKFLTVFMVTRRVLDSYNNDGDQQFRLDIMAGTPQQMAITLGPVQSAYYKGFKNVICLPSEDNKKSVRDGVGKSASEPIRITCSNSKEDRAVKEIPRKRKRPATTS